VCYLLLGFAVLPVLFYRTETFPMSNAQINVVAELCSIVCSFKKIVDVSRTDTAVECMKMCDCCEVSDVFVKRKLKFLHRDMLDLTILSVGM